MDFPENDNNEESSNETPDKGASDSKPSQEMECNAATTELGDAPKASEPAPQSNGREQTHADGDASVPRVPLALGNTPGDVLPSGDMGSSATQEVKAREANVIAQNISKIEIIKNQCFSYKEEPFIDPTTLLPGKPNSLFGASEEVNQMVERLKEYRVLVTDCFDDDTLEVAVYALIERVDLKGTYEKRMLAFEGGNSERLDLRLELLTYSCDKIGRGEKLIVVIDNVTKEKSEFLDSMFTGRLYARRMVEILAKRDIFLIYMTKPMSLQVRLQQEKTNFHFAHWNIPFLPHLLGRHFSSFEAEELEQQIVEQRKRGLWDESNSDIEFYELVSGYMRIGPQRLREEVKKRQTDGSRTRSEVLNDLKTVKPEALFTGDNEVKEVVLFVATFLPKLTLRDFEFVVGLLLQGRTAPVQIESQIITEQGDVKTIKKQEKKQLAEFWQQDADRILQECYLKAVRSDKLPQVIDFSLPYLRKEIRKFLEQEYPMYLQRQFERIQESGLLFNPSVSNRLTDNVICISVDMALSDPNYYGKDWLIGTVVGLKHALDFETVPGDEFELFLRILERIRGEKIKRLVFARLSDLIRHMLNYAQLQEAIEDFLRDLISTKHHDVVLEIVLEIARRLRFVPQFDALGWLKRLLDQGNAEIRDKTYLSLHEQAKQCGPRVYELLEAVKTWVPERDRKFEEYSPSNRYALQFIIEYCSNTTSALDPKYYGAWPSKYPLFATLEGTEDSAKDRFRDMADWLFHPGMKSWINDNLGDKDVIINVLLAAFIEEWSVILCGLKGQPHPEAVSLSDILLQEVIAATNDFQQKGLINYWRYKRGDYLQEINRLNVCQHEERANLKARRELVTKLEKRFRELKTQSV